MKLTNSTTPFAGASDFATNESKLTQEGATYYSSGRSFIVKSLTTATNALIPKKDSESPSNQPTRKALHVRLVSSVETSKQSPRSFVRALMGVNTNLDTHNDTDLTAEQADKYAVLADEVQKGRLSNTSAHLHAARSWYQHGGHSGLVGTLMNLSGAAISGVIDHSEYKLGRANVVES